MTANPVKTKAPDTHNQFHADQARLILESYRHWTGEDLLPSATEDPDQLGQMAFDAPFALVSHGTENDPIFNYANRKALETFGYTWEEWTTLPSRYSAEAPNREARAKLLEEVRQHGFSAGYQGVRIGKLGRFEIREAKVWNLIGSDGNARGQAACFTQWEWLDPKTTKEKPPAIR